MTESNRSKTAPRIRSSLCGSDSWARQRLSHAAAQQAAQQPRLIPWALVCCCEQGAVEALAGPGPLLTGTAGDSVVRERLRHVRWIGGGSGAGKSTIARALAAEYGLRLYHSDDTISDHARRSNPVDHPLMPRLVAPLLSRTDQGVWLVPTPEFRRDAFEARGFTWEIPRKTSDPERALANLLARDALFTSQITTEATAMGLPVIAVDSDRSIDEMVRLVGQALGLPGAVGQ